VQTDFFESLQKRFLAMRSKRMSLCIALVGQPGIGKTHATKNILQTLPCKSIGLHATSSASQIAAAIPKATQMVHWKQKQLDLLHKNELPLQAIPLLLALLLEQQAPVVLHLEDAHEANAAQLELIVELAKAILKTKGVALLITSRVQLPEPFTILQVPKLELAEVKDLITSHLTSELPTQALDYIYTRANGNPLFVLEFIRFLTRQGFLWSDGQEWFWREPNNGFVPVTLDALIGQWLSKSLQNTQSQLVLEARAFLPESLSSDILMRVWQVMTDLTTQDFNLATLDLIHQGLLLTTGFAHPLVREVILHELPAISLKNHAIRAVEALEIEDPTSAILLLESAQLSHDQIRQILLRIQNKAQIQNDQRLFALAQARMVWVLPMTEQPQAALEAAKVLEPFDYAQAAKLLEFAWQRNPADLTIVLSLAEFRFDQKRTSEISALLDGLPTELQEIPEVQGWRLVILEFQGRRSDAIVAWEAHPQWHKQVSAKLLALMARLCLREGRSDLMQEVIEFGLQRQGLNTKDLCKLLNVKALLLTQVQGNHQAALALYTKIFELDATMSSALLNRAMIRQKNFNELEGAKQDYEKVIIICSQQGRTILACQAKIHLASLERQLNHLSNAEKLLHESLLICEKSSDQDVLFECYMELSVYYRNLETNLQDLTSFKYAKLGLKLAKESNMAKSAMFRALYNCFKGSKTINELTVAKTFLDEIKMQIDLEQNFESPIQLRKMANYYDLLCEWNEATNNIAQIIELRKRAKIIYTQLDDENNQKIQDFEIFRLQKDLQNMKKIQAWFRAKNLVRIVEKIQYYIDLDNTNPLQIEDLPTKANLVLNVLGPIQIIQEGKEVQYRAKKRLELLIYLLEARAAGRSESNHLELLDALYPELTEAEAKNALKQSVYILRGKFGTDCIISTARGYGLGAVQSDLEELFIQPNSKLWRGTYLHGLGQNYFETVRGALLQQLFSAARNALNTDPTESIRLCQILLEMEPYDHEALKLLFQASTHQPHIARSAYQIIRQRYLEIGEELPMDMKTYFLEQRVLN
jgi:hypothetical protein